ncbi:CaiB/BaiF CoA-transferase family protein [Roseovarius sp. MMSF_3281]|uniref:CaiB/BaiF CoA transferase family protein n=1 Tax=Roseovarius sp. MMSF_3281 TaxID=3046694 RepID=UPI00273E457A|nr:CoA transferase [Roseovarius sp. MMSF_3281]
MTGTPLEGLRILDLTHVLAGPYATGQLALMGAEVIRVERPGSVDFVRRHGGDAVMQDAGLGASFLSQNAGKRSTVIDLKSDEGRDLVLRMAAQADVFVENFRPGVIDRLGLGYDAVRAVRPDVIYASISGFGPDGALSDRPAYDHILQGLSGLMAMTGTPESGPMRVGFPIVDYIAGQALIAAVLAAIIQRGKAPGQAQRLHVSMLDAVVNLMGPYAVNWQATGNMRGLEGNRAFSDSPFSGRFDTADGQIVVTANTPAQSVRLCAAIGRQDLVGETDNEAVRAVLDAVFAARPTAHWDRALAQAEVPAGPVLGLDDLLSDPALAALLSWQDLDVPELGRAFRVPGLSFSAPWAPRTLAHAPRFARDTKSVLAAMGIEDTEIDRLSQAGIIHTETDKEDQI